MHLVSVNIQYHTAQSYINITQYQPSIMIRKRNVMNRKSSDIFRKIDQIEDLSPFALKVVKTFLQLTPLSFDSHGTEKSGQNQRESNLSEVHIILTSSFFVQFVKIIRIFTEIYGDQKCIEGKKHISVNTLKAEL